MSRFFFALKPDEITREQIVLAQKELNLSGRLIKPENLHLTLLFMGKIEPSQQQKVIDLANEIRIPDFSFALNQIGSFIRSQVSWLGMSEIPSELIELNQKLLTAAEKCKINIQHQEYKPHVTLARKSKHPPLQQVNDINWTAKNFELIESIDTSEGAVYKTVKTFSLT